MSHFIILIFKYLLAIFFLIIIIWEEGPCLGLLLSSRSALSLVLVSVWARTARPPCLSLGPHTSSWIQAVRWHFPFAKENWFGTFSVIVHFQIRAPCCLLKAVLGLIMKCLNDVWLLGEQNMHWDSVSVPGNRWMTFHSLNFTFSLKHPRPHLSFKQSSSRWIEGELEIPFPSLSLWS